MTELASLASPALPPPVPGRTSHRIAWPGSTRVVVALLAIVAAYHYSLQSLLKAFSLDTPLAHVGLVPLISLGLAWLHRHRTGDVDILDRQLDWIVGLPLVLAALAMNFVLPARMSTDFWVMRIDMLTLPLFTTGVVALLFGVRRVWQFRLALGFLFLGWPYPYNQVLDSWLNEFTQVTIDALKVVVAIIPVASPVVGGDGSLFVIDHAGTPIQLSVASACSGANGLVGFLLIGAAFIVCVRGPRLRKAAWLATGAGIVWILNLVRIVIIFGSAKAWGEDVAIEGFHPFTGLVVFNLGVVGMLLLLKPFGLSIPSSRQSAPAKVAVAGPSPFAVDPHVPPPPPPMPAARRRHVPARAGLAFVLVAAGGLAFLNGDLRGSDLVSTSLGTPRLAPFAESKERLDGWKLSKVTTYDWARRFFGRNSVWTRYSMISDRNQARGPLWASTGIVVDVIFTDDRDALSAYGVEACYKFHDYRISRNDSVDLGNGVVGGLLTWTVPDDNQTWTTLYWHWPVKTKQGTRYERVTLLVGDGPNNQFEYPPLEEGLSQKMQIRVNDLLKGSSSDKVLNERLVKANEFIVAAGRDLIAKRAPAPGDG